MQIDNHIIDHELTLNDHLFTKIIVHWMEAGYEHQFSNIYTLGGNWDKWVSNHVKYGDPSLKIPYGVPAIKFKSLSYACSTQWL